MVVDLLMGPCRSALAGIRQWRVHWGKVHWREIRWGDWAAPALILVTPFVNFLGYNGYGLLRPESLLAIAVLAGAGLLASLAVAWRPRLLRPLLLAAALVVFVDIQPELTRPIVDFVARHWIGGVPRVFGHAVVVFACFLPFFAVLDALKQRAGTVLGTVFAVMLTATILLPDGLKWQRPNAQTAEAADTLPAAVAPANGLPPIVHIVLDEQAGIEGLPGDLTGGMDLRAELTEFYVGRGFQLHGRAFSHYFNTDNSIANLLNGDFRDQDWPFLVRSGDGFIVSENGWFDRLTEQGYRINVYQTSHMDFCSDDGHRIGRCAMNSMSILATIGDTDIRTVDKMNFMFESFVRYSVLFKLWPLIRHEYFDRPDDQAGETKIAAIRTQPPSLVPLQAKRLMERLTGDLRDAQPGTAYFAHFLLPHRAFVLDETCRMKPDLDTWFDHTHLGIGAGQRLSDASRSARYAEYFKQVRCTHRLLDQMLEALSDSGLSQDAIVIVHGDHGSRISGIPPTDRNGPRLTETDVMDGFSTLYAIRSPALEPGYDDHVRSIQALFAEHALRRPIADEEPTVFLTPSVRQPGRRLLRHPMSGFPPADRPLADPSTTDPATIDPGTIDGRERRQ